MTDLFENMSTEIPAALLPVRLEARFDGTLLRLRIYPDAIHAHAHDERLSPGEARLLDGALVPQGCRCGPAPGRS